MANEVAAPPKSGKRGMILWLLLAVAAVGGGASLPWIMGGHRHDVHADKKKAETPKSKLAVVPFGDVVVNLGEDRLTRFLRVKIVVAVEEADVKEVTELLATQKAFLKSWLIGYLSDQSTQEITRKVGVNRIRREIRNQFNAMLFADGEEKVNDILFDEFMIQ
ncbi:MAG TPA: flagellar basal body-associated FliL family protein [Gemmataceae bacterium]|nr:flagellar basal body-associated FliL family protein [Gemmataceae bacterium]